jgi:hypothetical protein
MRELSAAFILATTLAFPNFAIAGSPRHDLGTITVSARPVEKFPARGTYRGQFYDMSSIEDRADVPELMDALRHQIDDVQNLKLSRRVLGFFQSVPVVVDDFSCLGHMTAPESGEPKPAMDAACYGHQVPATTKVGVSGASLSGNETTSNVINSDPLTQTRTTGIVLIRPITLIDKNKARPILLHELLHSYHDRILPGGFANPAAKSWFKQASEQGLYPPDQYLMTNEREFFAVTASVFLSGKDGALVRADIKKKQPDYYTYLKWLFQFDPDGTSESPVASAN